MKRKVKNKRKMPAKKSNYKDLLYKHELLQDLMEHTPDVIYFKDRKGRLVLVNRAHAKGLGLEPKDVVGKTDFDIFSEKRAERMIKDDEYVMATGKPIMDKVERHTRADGVDNYVSTTKIPRYDNEGNIVGLIGITRDITHRIQLERLREEKDRIKKKLEDSEELNQMKSDLISIVSHELKTPLSIVKEAILLVFEGFKGPVNEGQRELLTKAKNNVGRLKNIIEELLDVPRIEKGKIRLRHSLVNLNGLIKYSADFFKRVAQDKGLNLKYRLPGEQVNVFMDSERMNQVISNLVSNAIKFTEQGGKIDIEVRVFKNTVRIGVRDTGIGISKQNLSRVFDRYRQIPGAHGVRNRGIGLGLSISKELVERHGGEIWAESKVGIGSKFYFTLPRFYTMTVLSEDIRGKINDLLDKGVSLYLIDLSIINYRKFKKVVRVGNRGLIKELEGIIDTVLKEFLQRGKKKFKIFLTDFKQGVCRIVFPEATEKEATKLCGLFRDKIDGYFVENGIENIFVKTPALDLSYKVESAVPGQIPLNVHMKRISVGIEKRRFERIKYETGIEPIFPTGRMELSNTLDISEGGVGFITQKRLKTDSRLKIKLNLPKRRDPLSIATRVAWIRQIEEPRKKGASRYKAGLEFIQLGEEDKKAISKFIDSVSNN